MEKGKKCIASSCEKCNFYRYWNLENEKGEKSIQQRCSFDMLFAEIPRIRGSIDGVQESTNETRNVVMNYGYKSVKTLKALTNAKLLEG